MLETTDSELEDEARRQKLSLAYLESISSDVERIRKIMTFFLVIVIVGIVIQVFNVLLSAGR